jgi:hypothetical protein
MTTAQTQRFEHLLAEYAKTKTIDAGVRGLIHTLACVELEEERLQDFVNSHGTTYEANGLIKTRPEWAQLREARLRKHTLITCIDRRAENNTEEELTELEKQYFS